MPTNAQAGATAVEYSIVLSMVAVVIIVAVAFLGSTTRDMHECNKDAVTQPESHPGGPCP